MNIPLFFFICLGVALIGIITAFVNMGTAISGRLLSAPGKVIVVHIFAGLLYVLGGIGTLAFGIAWIVTYLKH